MPPLYRRHPKPAGIIILNHFLMLSPLLYDYSTIDLSHQLPSIYVLTARQRTVCIQLFDAYIQMFATSVASLHPTRCATTISPSYNACASAIPFILLKTLTSSGSLSPIHVALCVWSRSPPSSVFGCTSTLNGPRFITNHEMKAPNWAGVNRFTSNMATGCGPTGLSKIR